jgi:FkbM family methyltransferase
MTRASRWRYEWWRAIRSRRMIEVRLRTGETIRLRPPPAGDIATAYELWVMRQYEPPWPIARPELVVDLGCNVGLSLAYFHARYRHAHVIGFEPHPEHFRIAQSYGGHRVDAHRVAAGVGDGTAKLTDDGTASTVSSTGTVEVRTIDIFSKLQRKRIDLLKMDIEGGEYALLGDERFGLLDVYNLVMEWHATSPEHRGRQWCIERLRSFGYEVRDATPAQATMGLLWARRLRREFLSRLTSTPRATVIIPAYNCAHRVGVPLEALAAQDAAAGSFEVVVVDNASRDDTARAAIEHPATAALRSIGCDVRVVREDRAGLGFARARGVAAARGQIVCFVEDDTVPAPDFVREGLRAFEDSSVGLIVSQFAPRYEHLPPEAVRRREHLFGVNVTQGDSLVDYGAGATAIPSIGAGLWVRKTAWEQAMGGAAQPVLRDRAGPELGTGGDIEIGYLVGRAGWKRLYWPAARLEHVIAARRFRLGYFCKLIRAIVRSELRFAKRYDTGPGRYSRPGAVGRLFAALLATPFLVLRDDGLREVAFVLTDRWARVMGPYPRDPG